jgi:uncharacterized protein (DUF697 family)
MTRKPLPKAIRRPLGDLPEFAADTAVEREAPRAAPSFDAVETEPALTISSVPAANDPLPENSDQVRSLAAKRRSLARKIVDRHRTFAALGGLVPLPVVNIASVTAINLRMVKQLSELYQVPFQRDRTRSMIIGLMGGAVPTGLGAAAASTLTFIMPGGAFVGLGVSAITAAALTRGIGLVFVESFENGAITAEVQNRP